MQRPKIHPFIALLPILFYQVCIAQSTQNPYGLPVLTTAAELQRTIEADSNRAFVRIKDYVPGVLLDIKYATTQNVFYTQLYDRPHAYTRLPVAKALAAAQKEFNAMGYGIKIYDAYRPYQVTRRMFEMLPDTIYMGLPWKGSTHNRGIALDMTLVDLKTKQELDMPTPFDALVYASHPDFKGLPEPVLKNRQLLIDVMARHGFSVDPVEWWHFNYASGRHYELLDVPPDLIGDMLKKSKKKPSD